jgi:hypothetical protein
MPKKTKKEKIIADYRKKIKLLKLKNSSPQFSPLSSLPIKKTPIRSSPPPSSSSSLASNNLLAYFKQDFRKSLLLTILIIGLEICLYFVSINQYFKFK